MSFFQTLSRARGPLAPWAGTGHGPCPLSATRTHTEKLCGAGGVMVTVTVVLRLGVRLASRHCGSGTVRRSAVLSVRPITVTLVTVSQSAAPAGCPSHIKDKIFCYFCQFTPQTRDESALSLGHISNLPEPFRSALSVCKNFFVCSVLLSCFCLFI